MNETLDKTQGLTCPNCRGVVPVPEGVRLVRCPYCDQRSLVQGEQGVRRWQVARQLDRDQALETVKGFFSGMKKAPGLKQKAEIRELFLVYLPYWRVTATVAGWMFGRVKSGKDSTRPIEVEVLEEMEWNDAATDVAEFGVHQVTIRQAELQPYDSERLHQEGMIFEPSESRTEALAEAEQHFSHQARSRRSLKRKFFEKFHILRPQLGLVYYPLWVARYEYRQRNYQVVVDGTQPKVLYGKAPGNIFYRAAALVAGMAFGNLILVNGTALALTLLGGSNGGDDDSFAFACIPAVVGIALIVAGYRAFRYGEEVEEVSQSARKARLGGEGEETLDQTITFVKDLVEGAKR